jgi:catechol 2,3-dioxygenase-like lactoylglutathione lyase family enzyme
VITGFHTIVYSDDPEATRRFFRDVLRWPSLDAGGGWLVFKTPPGELGVHPTADDATERWSGVPFHQASLMCDDIEATVAELRAQGVDVQPEVRDQGFGLVTSVDVPGAGWLMLYQPRHGLAYELEG